MNKKYIPVLFILLLLLFQPLVGSSFSILNSSYQLPEKPQERSFSFPQHFLKQNRKSSFLQIMQQTVSPSPDKYVTNFTPENISLSDDAYHGSDQGYGIEWWYFDTTLNEKYTLQFTIHVYTILNTGIVTTQCQIYENNTKIIDESTIYPLSTVHLSTKKPFITINDNIVLRTQNHSKEEPWLYQLKYTQGNYSFNLTFHGTTTGWKGTTAAGGWTVALPKAFIQGNLTINDVNQKVTGIGYHDHNWNVSVSTGLNFGWLWGKTVTKNYTFTWANIFKTWYQKNPLLVINKEHDGFINIPPELIDFSITKIEFKNAMIIPYGFHITAKTQEYDIFLSIEILDTDHSSILGLINYWRYHIHTTGTIRISDTLNNIDNYDIAEFMRFRPY